MAELFIELYSEEIPAKLQIDARHVIKQNIEEKLKKKEINFKSSKSFSTPKRLVFVVDGIPEKIEQKKKIIKGPKVGLHQAAVDGFIKSNNIDQSAIYKKKIEKGEFYFAEIKPKTIDVLQELQSIIPEALKTYSWKKSMKWSTYDLSWGRPLKSITALFNEKIINFNFFHIKSDNLILIDDEYEDKVKKVNNFKSYLNILKTQNIVLDQKKRREIILKRMNTICKSKNLKNNFNEKLIEEVVNLVEKPNVILCKFDEIYLKVPQEILIITMQQHQKYFPTFDKKGNITKEFLVVTNKKDKKGLIKLGNERVVEARLSDAEFFWQKDKAKNLVKKVSKLKSMNYFKGLGTYFDKAQRIRKLGGMLSDELLISKEKVELSASICKVDLLSDLVGEFPELQGIMGGYFAEVQGFDRDISLAVSEQYLPTGYGSKVPKKFFSIALSLADKIDTLVGFFGINQKPTSSKDPYALRRLASGIIRTIVENKKDFKIKDLINYSSTLYLNQGFDFENKFLQKELSEFLMERLKFYMKEEKIRHDIIHASTNSFSLDKSVVMFGKAKTLNKIISKPLGIDIISSYKRAFNILDSETKDKKLELSNITDPSIFKTEYEKNLLKKINELKKYFSEINQDEDYVQSLTNLANSKKDIFEFFDNVIVNEENPSLKKNRLELIQMLCKTFDNYVNFSLIDYHQ